tara:strand:+ start:120 stop:890 length:771 start_codon:yes stop_codon:yes gene_type:complete
MYIDGWKQLVNLFNEEGSVTSEVTQAREKSGSYRGLAARAKNPEAKEILSEPSPVYDYFKMFYESNEGMAKGRIKSSEIYKEGLGSDYVDTNPNKFASELASDLTEFGLGDEAIAGIIGSLDYESLGFTRYKEIKGPGVSAAQYTNMRGVDEAKRKEFIRDRDYAGLVKIGARKDAFLAHSQDKGLDPRSYEAFRDFMFYEFRNTGEGSILNKLDRAKNPEQAADIFTNSFLRPKKETANLSKRRSNARKYYSTYN